MTPSGTPSSLLDRLLLEVDAGLRSVSGVTRIAGAERENPARSEAADLSESERRHAAGLMRVNHAGEVCAQALYRGQAMTAKDPAVREHLHEAAMEEQDHLAWCEERLDELGDRTSALNPLWYAASFGLGALTGLLGDKVSLGFVAATEEKVGEHLMRHAQSLPQDDSRSREIVQAMYEDETRHGEEALDKGGQKLSPPVRSFMAGVARLMTGSSYRI